MKKIMHISNFGHCEEVSASNLAGHLVDLVDQVQIRIQPDPQIRDHADSQK